LKLPARYQGGIEQPLQLFLVRWRNL
jgi:hypothetical protein